MCLHIHGYADSIDDDDGPPELITSRVAIEDFGEYIEQHHDNSNRGFKDQYYVSAYSV